MLIVKSAEEEVKANYTDLAGIFLDQPFFLSCIRERIYLNKNNLRELQLPMVLAVLGLNSL